MSKDALTIDQKIRKEWQLEALDKFMKECGDATLYTATVSKNFTISDLIALKRFMYKHDTGRMIKMAHQRFEETGLSQWKVSEKWRIYDPTAKAKDELSQKVKLATN